MSIHSKKKIKGHVAILICLSNNLMTPINVGNEHGNHSVNIKLKCDWITLNCNNSSCSLKCDQNYIFVSYKKLIVFRDQEQHGMLRNYISSQ